MPFADRRREEVIIFKIFYPAVNRFDLNVVHFLSSCLFTLPFGGDETNGNARFVPLLSCLLLSIEFIIVLPIIFLDRISSI